MNKDNRDVLGRLIREELEDSGRGPVAVTSGWNESNVRSFYGWRDRYRADARAALEAAAPHLLAEADREFSDAKRVIALLVRDAGGKVTISRRAVSELSDDAVIETIQDVVNGGWVIRAKQ